MEQAERARQIFLETLQKCAPAALIEKQLSITNESISIGNERPKLSTEQPIYIIGAGKASLPMVQALQQKTGAADSHICCVSSQQNSSLSYAMAASHPLPDDRSVQAARRLINFVEQIPSNALIFFALSGGASALLCKPAEGVALENISAINRHLLASGATIEEINSVRKHLSAIKGGQLLTHINPACTLVDLVISDVPGNDLEMIGSGPTTPDSTTFREAYDTLLRYGLWEEAPPGARKYIRKGLNGDVPETVKPGQDPVEQHYSLIIGSADIFARAMGRQIEKEGIPCGVANEPFNDDVKTVAQNIFEKIKKTSESSGSAKALIFYGESTVEVTGGGMGGRNQELALRGAQKIADMQNIIWLSAGTDGIDGPTDAAGAVVDDQTIANARKKELDAEQFLNNNDSYHFHERMGTLFKTGPTGNNMMDITLILIDKN